MADLSTVKLQMQFILTMWVFAEERYFQKKKCNIVKGKTTGKSLWFYVSSALSAISYMYPS